MDGFNFSELALSHSVARVLRVVWGGADACHSPKEHLEAWG